MYFLSNVVFFIHVGVIIVTSDICLLLCIVFLCCKSWLDHQSCVCMHLFCYNINKPHCKKTKLWWLLTRGQLFKINDVVS